MSTGNCNVVTFPREVEVPDVSRPNEERSVIIVSDDDSDLTIVRHILDDAGQPRTQVVESKITGLREILEDGQADIVLIRDRALPRDPKRVDAVLKKLTERVPVLILSDETDQESTGKYLTAGARDVVSLEHPKRLQSVITRECGVLQLRRALERAQGLSSNYRSQVKWLTQTSTQGIADVRDGSIVGANSAWTELFHCNDIRQLINTPLLDSVSKTHRSEVKQLMVKRQNGNRRGSSIKIIGEGADGTKVPLNMSLERIRVGGETAIRFTAWSDSAMSGGMPSVLDEPTKLYNRTHFIEQLQTQLSTPLSGGVRALTVIRLDRFSKVLDSVGVLDSERVLAHFADVLRELAHPSDLYGRFGGTVFSILVNRGSMREVEAWLQHLSSVIEERPFDNAGNAVQLSCTAGICEITDSQMSVETILREAHDACHHGRLKGSGGAHLGASSQTARSKSKESAKAAYRIQQALRNDRFRLIRKPVIRLDNSYCKIRDTWIRMIGEDGEDILPQEFLPFAERHNLMTLIDRWVIGASVTYCAKRQPDLIFVRLSQDSVLDESLTEWVCSVVDASPAQAAQLCFQTTAAIAEQNLKQTVRQARHLNKMGFKFAIDQLGVSPESMNILKYVPMQYARIDAALLQGVARDERIQAQLAEFVRISKAHGIQVVGDRIEDAATMAAAFRIGIEYAQGDYVSCEEIVLEDTNTLCMPILPAA